MSNPAPGNLRPQSGGIAQYGTPQQTAVVYLGAGLVIVANFTNIAGAFHHALGSPKAPVPQSGGPLVWVLVGEIVFVFILWLLAGISQSAGTFALLLAIGMWVAWALNHAGIFTKIQQRSG